MDKNNSMIEYKENFFQKVVNKIKSFFFMKKTISKIDKLDKMSTTPTLQQEKQNTNQQSVQMNEAAANITNKDELEQNIEMLAKKYENGEIKEENLESSEVDSLKKYYDEMTAKLGIEISRKSEQLMELKRRLGLLKQQN